MKRNKIFTLIIAFCLWQFASAQESGKKSDKMITITGKVFNKDHNPVEGAILYVDNVKTSNKSKSNGSYKIKISPSAVNLEARSPEYGTSEIELKDHTIIDFILDGVIENQQLITAASGENKESAGNSKKPSGSRGKKMNTYSNIYQMIRGEVSGVVVSGRSVQIQQGHSFFGSSEPLFVVNGIVVTTIDNVNPVEVKSISVLKGSSAAIYGVRGANGVISINLLNGSEKQK